LTDDVNHDILNIIQNKEVDWMFLPAEILQVNVKELAESVGVFQKVLCFRDLGALLRDKLIGTMKENMDKYPF
jgi:hypothetical protein